MPAPASAAITIDRMLAIAPKFAGSTYAAESHSPSYSALRLVNASSNCAAPAMKLLIFRIGLDDIHDVQVTELKLRCIFLQIGKAMFENQVHHVQQTTGRPGSPMQ